MRTRSSLYQPEHAAQEIPFSAPNFCLKSTLQTACRGEIQVCNTPSAPKVYIFPGDGGSAARALRRTEFISIKRRIFAVPDRLPGGIRDSTMARFSCGETMTRPRALPAR